MMINLAHEPTYLEFARNPRELDERLTAVRPRGRGTTCILIDEVQRLPSLLNTIQSLLDDSQNRLRFLLTGSSARKLRRGNANLLPGRIHTYRLGPLVARELDYRLDTKTALAIGTLPGVYLEEDRPSARKTLRSYAATYLKEEVQAEALTRNVEGFARFLHVAGTWSGTFLDLAKMSAAAQVPRQTTVRYFEILEDCLIAHRCEPFAKSTSPRLIQHPRYFFFDVGVLNGLLGNFEVSADRIGMLFEHLIYTQIAHGAASCDRDIRLSCFRTEHGAEVDVVVELGSNVYAIEIKASHTIGRSDTKGLKRFAEYYGKPHHSWILYLGSLPKQIDGVRVLPWQSGLQEMGL
jgi:predicted AAA+ superfamily ATPase